MDSLYMVLRKICTLLIQFLVYKKIKLFSRYVTAFFERAILRWSVCRVLCPWEKHAFLIHPVRRGWIFARMCLEGPVQGHSTNVQSQLLFWGKRKYSLNCPDFNILCSTGSVVLNHLILFLVKSHYQQKRVLSVAAVTQHKCRHFSHFDGRYNLWGFITVHMFHWKPAYIQVFSTWPRTLVPWRVGGALVECITCILCLCSPVYFSKMTETIGWPLVGAFPL